MVAAAQKQGRVIMRRLVVSLSVVVVLLLGVVATLGRGAIAQEATPDPSAMMAMATHPFVGTWIVDTLSESETDSPEIAVWQDLGPTVWPAGHGKSPGHAPLI